LARPLVGSYREPIEPTKGDERPERHVPVQDLVGAEREHQNPADGD
jgi:hypothetical protein